MSLKFSSLNRVELGKINKAALEILETVGIKIDGNEARGICQTAGASVEKNNIVKFPPAMIQKAVEKCIPKISLYHRNTDEEMAFGDGIIKHSVGGWTSEILDWRTGNYRKALLEDLIETVKICEALEEVSWFMSPLLCADVNPAEIELHQYKTGVEHSNKPMILSASDGKTVEKIAKLASILAGGKEKLTAKPNFAVAVGLMSPLLLTSDLCEIAITSARLGIPLWLYTSALSGATTPVTLAGTLAGNHAEFLAAITLIKLVNPDAIIFYHTYSKVFDMKTSDSSAGSPEFARLAAASVQLGKSIGLPSGTGMFFTDSPQLDIQAWFEKIGTSVLPSLAGADFSNGMGYLGKNYVVSLESVVFDAEVASFINRMLVGIDCDDDHLAVDVYKEVKPLGNFLSTKHTLDFFRSEMWNPKFAYKGSYSSWTDTGRKESMASNVKAYLEKTLNEYKSLELPDEFLKEFEKNKS